MLPTTTALQRRIDWWQDRISLHWQNFRATEEKWKYIKEKAARWKKQTRWKVQAMKDHVRDRVARAFYPEKIRQVRAIGYRAGTTYEPRPYEGKVTLFRAMEQPRGIFEDRTLGWGPLVLGGLEIYDTPGHHGAIVREPRSRVLAEQLKDALSKVELQVKTVPPEEPERELVEVGS
jgi:thioesterase domain-containing protein